MESARRILTYGVVLLGLFTALYASSHLLSLLLTTLLAPHSLADGAGDVRQDLSLYLAALIVGLPLWLGAATAANRQAREAADERNACERPLFLAFVFAITSLMSLISARSLLGAVLAWVGTPGNWFDARGAISAGAQLVVYSAAWLYHARVGWAERAPRDSDQAHDLAVYVLAGYALAYLAYGMYEAMWRIVNILVGSALPGTAGWTAWSDIAASILAGGAIWSAVWRYDLLRAGRRTLRVLYLYLVLGIATPMSLWGAFDGTYEVLRRLLGYRAGAGFLREVVPTVAIGGAVWAYHWYVVRAQAAYASSPPQPPGSIAWPRRPGLAMLTLLGHAITVPGTISLFWLGLDVLFDHGRTGSDWWRAQLSARLAAILVGGVTWLGAWLVLQGAASASPQVERTARARKLVLGAIVLVNALPATGFAIALLWLILRALLGERLDANALSDALKYLSATAILTATAVTHAMLLTSASAKRNTSGGLPGE
jgi:hypothetical protein